MGNAEGVRELQARLETVHEELAELTTGLSHDLQAPLRAIAGFMELLQEEYGGTFDDTAREYVAFAVGGARRMQGMVDGLVRLSRASSVAITPTPVQPEEAWLDAQLRLRSRIDTTHAEVSADPLPRIEHDPVQLRELLECLLDNALRFHGDRPPRIRLWARCDARGTTLVVEDQGLGLGTECTERAFRPFDSLHPHLTGCGSGLGLCVARRIAHRHGQRIWLEPNEPRGSRACFTVRSIQG